MTTPYHGEALLWTSELGWGMSSGHSDYRTSGCDLSERVAFDFSDPEAEVNSPGSTVRMWPFEGAIKVPIKWWGGEIPDPLANYGGDRNDVGPVMFFFSADDDEQTIELSDKSGKTIPLLLPGGNEAQETVTIPSSQYGTTQSIFAARVLKGKTNYTLTVRGGDSTAVHFRTAARENYLEVYVWKQHQGVRFGVFSMASDPVLTLHGRGRRRVVTLSPQDHMYLSRWHRLRRGKWRACASSGGGESEFAVASRCSEFASRA